MPSGGLNKIGILCFGTICARDSQTPTKLAKPPALESSYIHTRALKKFYSEQSMNHSDLGILRRASEGTVQCFWVSVYSLFVSRRLLDLDLPSHPPGIFLAFGNLLYIPLPIDSNSEPQVFLRIIVLIKSYCK